MKLSQTCNRRAFTLLELVVLVACLALLTALILPAFVRRSCARSARINCINNLKQIGLSYRTWALDNQDKYPMQVSVTNGGTMELINSGPAYVHFLVMSNELSTPKILVCPDDPERINATTFSANCVPGQVPFTNDSYLSYFVGVDANPDLPNALLSGDRNLAVDNVPVRAGMQRIWTNSTLTWFKPRGEHMGGGNVGLADGSVQSLTSTRLKAALQYGGMATNRLVIP